MCTEKCFKLTRRGALVGGTAVAVSAAMGGVAQAGERDHRHPGFPHGRRGLLDLTHPLTTTIPPFAPGEEPKRRTVSSSRQHFRSSPRAWAGPKRC